MLADDEVFGGTEILAVPVFAGNRYLELMFTGRNIAGVDTLNAALLQSLQFLETVYVVRDKVSVELDLDRVKAELLAITNVDEDREMSVRWIEQSLFEYIKLGGDPQDVRLDLLNLLVEALHLLPGCFLSNSRKGVEAPQDA